MHRTLPFLLHRTARRRQSLWRRATVAFGAGVMLAACTGGNAPSSETTDTGSSHAAHRALAERLIGHWHEQQVDGNLVFHEEWRRTGNGDLEGLGYVMSGQDTVFIEHLGIRYADDGIRYMALIPTQNNGVAVPFRATDATDSLVFENPDHDFPQRIVYAPQPNGTWAVTVSGAEDGEPRTERYRFRPFTGEAINRP